MSVTGLRDDTGAFRRPPSAFRGWIEPDGEHPPEAGRYHLYVSLACPWAHRTVIARRLKGLEEVISLSLVDPIRDDDGWAFTGGEFTDPVNGFRLLAQAYHATDTAYTGRVSVPVLWDCEHGVIVNNESADILRILDSAFGDLADDTVVLYPPELREDIDAVNQRVYETLNNGVYASGFAGTQEAYEAAVVPLFETLDWLEERLTDRSRLVGDVTTEADWRLFTTLVRFDAVYHGHFKCNLRRIVDLPALSRYLGELLAEPGIADTVDLDQIKRHYYRTHPSINPTRIVPVGPADPLPAP
ncbi:MAG TPA: glutathione S-transferase family protein [Solirubrobacteraceae bacterium]|nr:glutathione S-transferase family protein [Solirubrobacteraceae bacterium]